MSVKKDFKEDMKNAKKMMTNPTKKQKALGFIALIVILVAIYFVTQDWTGFQYEPTIELPPIAETTYEDLYIPGSLQEEYGKGGQKQCTFTHDLGGALIEGNLLYDETRVSLVSATIPIDQEPEQDLRYENRLISDGEYAYAWIPDAPTNTGLQVPVKTEDETMLRSGLYLAGEVNFGLNIVMEFECSDWEVDESVFEVPEDIEFTKQG